MVQRPESAKTGEKAVLLVESVVNELNWVSNRLHNDFGVDLHVEVFDSQGARQATPREFYVRVKDTATLRVVGGKALFRIDTEHLVDWFESRLPVLLAICDITKGVCYAIAVRPYLEKLDEEGHDWEAKSQLTVRVPVANAITPRFLKRLLADIKRASLIEQASAIITRFEEPSDCRDEHTRISSVQPFKHPLEPPGPSIQDLALARCILCESYFWIERAETEGSDTVLPGDDVPVNCCFTKIVEPWPHQLSLFSCDSPEVYCPYCRSGGGALERCARCKRYRIPRLDETFLPWDDPLITENEAREQ